jgi:hypothetical protein
MMIQFSRFTTIVLIVLLVGITTTITGQDIPSSLTDIAFQCPTEVARVTPCIDTNTSLEECTACFSGSVLGSNVSAIPTECVDLQELACQGLTDCAVKCGLSTLDNALFTFGSECDDLFISMIGCIVQTQGIGTNCTFESCPNNNDASAAAGNSGWSSSTALHTLIATTTFLATIGMLF